MATDLQFIFPSEALPTTNVVEVPRGDLRAPRVLRAVGQDFRAVAEVLINGVESPAVVVASETRLTAEVPSVVGEDDVVTFEVLSARVSLTDRSVLRFRLGSPTRKATGLLRLMQFYLGILLRAPNRDIFSPEIGGDALASLGETVGGGTGANAIANLTVALSRTNRHVIALQARDTRAPRDEKLLSARLESARIDRATASLVATVALTSQAGRTGRALVTT